jgi:hypothetical protein
MTHLGSLSSLPSPVSMKIADGIPLPIVSQDTTHSPVSCVVFFLMYLNFTCSSFLLARLLIMVIVSFLILILVLFMIITLGP